MELIKIFWVFIFFVFTLLLLFVWSKIYIISKKLQSVIAIATDMKPLAEQLGDQNTAQSDPAVKNSAA